MPLRFLIKTAITVVTPPVVCNTFPLHVTHLTAVEPSRDRRRIASPHFRDCTAVVLRRHGGDGGATAVVVRCHGGHGGAAATPLRIGPTRGGTAKVLNMFKVSAVPPRRSEVLTDFGGATSINDGTTAEPQLALCRTSTAVTPRLRCDGDSTAETQRNMLKVSAMPPRRSAVLTVFRGATAINDGTPAKPRRSWLCHCGLCRTSTAMAPGLRFDGVITFVSITMAICTELYPNKC